MFLGRSSVRTSVLMFSVFSATAYPIDSKIFTISVTTRVECFNDNYGVIGHVVWQPCWKKEKTLDVCISESAPLKNLKLAKCQGLPMWKQWSFIHLLKHLNFASVFILSIPCSLPDPTNLTTYHLFVHLHVFSPSALLLGHPHSPPAVPFVMLHPDPFCVLALPWTLSMHTKIIPTIIHGPVFVCLCVVCLSCYSYSSGLITSRFAT